MKLKRLRVRNVASFSDLTLDLDSLPAGVIAITGANGAGKTTLLECLGPAPIYRQWPSREEPNFANLCRTDAGRAGVDLTCDYRGHEYTFSISATASGAVGATATRDGVALVNGKIGEYKDLISQLFPPQEVYYSCHFAGQGGAHRVSNQTASERKAVLSSLLGLDRMRAIAAAASAKAAARAPGRTSADCSEAVNARVSARTEVEARLRVLRADLRDTLSDLAQAREVADRLEGYRARVAAEDRLATANANLRRALADRDQAAGGQPPGDEPAPVDLGALDAERTAIEGEIESFAARHRSAGADKSAAEYATRDARNALDRAQTAAESRREALGAATEAAQGLRTVPCGGEGVYGECKFLASAMAKRDRLPALDRAVADADDTVSRASASLAEAEARFAAATATNDSAHAEWDRARQARLPVIQNLRDRARAYEAARAAWNTARNAYQAALAKVANTTAAVDGARAVVAQIEADLATLPELPAGVGRAQIDNARAHVRDLEIAASGTEREIAAAEGRIQSFNEAVDALRAELDQAAAAEAAQAPYQMIARAFGAKGLQALAIDEAGPAIETIANEILAASFEGRFTISVQTQVDKASGDGVKETLQILVTDTKRSGAVPIGQLSFGEQAMIEESVRIAYSIYGMRGDDCIQTILRDEPIGHLTPENNVRYVIALRQAIRIGGLHRAFFVTHSEDAAASADAHLHVNADGTVTVR